VTGNMVHMAETLNAADGLTDKASKIASGAPYWKSPLEEWARLYMFEDGTAALEWPRAVTDFGDPEIETESLEFPSSLLLLSDAEIDAWQVEKAAEHRRLTAEADAKQAEKASVAVEEYERLMYERLKAKFAPKPSGGIESSVIQGDEA
jgi:hypothetical protein